MRQDFQVQIVDQCGGVLITHPSIKSAKEHLAELPQIPNAPQSLKQLGVEVLNIIVKLNSSVGVCVGRIKLDPELAITLDDTWREWCGGFDSVKVDSKETSANAKRYPLFSKEATLCHAAQSTARNDRAQSLKALKDSKNCGGALQALKNLGKVSDLGGRAFHKFFNLAKLPTQS